LSALTAPEPAPPTVRRVGHKGAHHIAPGNTRASFDAALAHRVDMIEFDVLATDMHAAATCDLVLAHDYAEDLSAAHTLEEGLEHLASPAFANVELDLDLKVPGCEQRVVEALHRHGLIERTLISTQYMRSLVAIRALEPRLRLGWSVPRVKRDYTQYKVFLLPALGVLQVMRRRLPAVAAAHLRAGRCDALMAHWRLVTPRLVETVRGAGGELYVWTVDDARVIRRLEALGVSGIITNDPRLFTADPR
jgi:glycerophosphoryl diester phosphodiesterase